MVNFSKKILKKLLNLFRLDIRWTKNVHKYPFLGLKNLSILTVIDVGANEGQFAKQITSLLPNAQLFCFEPLIEPFNKLKEWSEKQKNGQIKVFNTALGNKEGILEFFNHTVHSYSSSFLKSTDICSKYYPAVKKKELIQVKVKTLDRWIKDLTINLKPQILIKLDVQGYENRVIEGGREIFKIANACILEINLDSLYEQQASFKEIYSLLDGFGYHYAGNLEQIYADDGHVLYIDALFLK